MKLVQINHLRSYIIFLYKLQSLMPFILNLELTTLCQVTQSIPLTTFNNDVSKHCSNCFKNDGEGFLYILTNLDCLIKQYIFVEYMVKYYIKQSL